MQIKKLAPTLMEQWIKVYEERPKLSPNAITGEALAAYLKEEKGFRETENEPVCRSVFEAVQSNAFFRAKLEAGKAPRPAAFSGVDGTTVGVDLETGYFQVDGDYRLRDELTYRKGLDGADLDNILRTVDWLRCRRLYENKRTR